MISGSCYVGLQAGLFLASEREEGVMRKTILTILAMFAIISGGCVTQDAFADGNAVVRHSKKVRHVYHRPRGACPDRYSCYSLFGAYGPYGGAPYWGRYTYEGWGYRW